ncbi:MAG TPA: phage portal protein, partial [Candidatus Dwaynia gallinarum]|nr:phage portal protein [Candidatus Dwaynia gallinarum]
MFKKIFEFFKRNKSPTLGVSLRNNLDLLSSLNGGYYKEKLLEIHSLIYAAVDRKSKAIAQLPLRLYKNDMVKENKCVFKRKRVVNNDISYIFDTSPNKNMTPYIFWRTVIAQKEIYGNSYVYIKRGSIGEVLELEILDPSKVSIYLSKSGEVYYKPYNDKEIYLHNLDILHFSSIYVSGYKGISFIECLRTQLNFKENVIKMNSEQMEKSIKAGATLKLPSNLSMDKMK